MINAPEVLVETSFQMAWIEVVKLLADNHWDKRNLIVHIQEPGHFCQDMHQSICNFTKHNNLLGPKHVAYTIFPHNLYKKKGNASSLFTAYNRKGGFYDRRRSSWGTYFRRMTQYEGNKGVVNQLENTIEAICSRENTHKAAYTILIQHPGGETIRPLGGPCLNYIAIQLNPGQQRELGLLAIYRNHDFLKRAYGNYWGLCNLLCFLAKETNSHPGPLTCISSHAYVDTHKVVLKDFMVTL